MVHLTAFEMGLGRAGDINGQASMGGRGGLGIGGWGLDRMNAEEFPCGVKCISRQARFCWECRWDYSRRSRTGALLSRCDWTDLDAKVSEALSSYWVNFAANGDPNGNGLVKWPAYDDQKSAGPMLLGEHVLGDQAEVGSVPNAARLAFFEAVYEKQRR